VLKYGIQKGIYWHITVFYLYSGFNATEWGNEKLALHYLSRLNQIKETFENKYTVVQYHRLQDYIFVKFRKNELLLRVSQETLNLALKTNNALTLLLIHCYRSMAFTFLGNAEEAKISLDEAGKMIKDMKSPLVVIFYLIARSYNEIAGIKMNGKGSEHAVSLLKTTKELVSCAGVARANLTEAYRLRAVACRILNKPAGAAKNFKRSIQAGMGYGGNLELSRTYFEAGKFLRDPKNKKERILGMNGTECLLKAKAMFEEMNLQWDLQQYEKYMNSGV